MTAFVDAEGATPLDPDEARGLIPAHIATQADLNAWEEANILQGVRWAARQRKRELLDEGFVRDLHRKMFDLTWAWAGTLRSSNKNIGVDWTQVSMRLRDLLDNTRYQVEHRSTAPDEMAVSFHHRLVSIHAFPNGNGRHARLTADELVLRLARPRFTWGSNSLVGSGDPRTRYLDALRAADAGEVAPLLRFARS
ncbi:MULTISPECIES: mobile mystery protein B [unclassified Variovorax]|uniref:mobile mystery protein B n=1 Tax=unclassified Variovorax TaxID=663243 RepID=UPI003ED0C220